MNRLKQIVASIGPQSQPEPVCWDLGSLHTRLMIGGKVVYNQPSCYLQQIETGSVLSLGEEALQLRGKEPPQTELVFPIQQGVVFQRQQLTTYLQAVLDRHQIRYWLPAVFPGKAAVVVPAAATSLDKKILLNIFSQIGQSNIQFVSLGSAILAKLKQNFSQSLSQYSLVVVDIGANLTDIAVFVNDKLLLAQTIDLGGEDVTDQLRRIIKQQYQLNVSWQSVEALKRELTVKILADEEAGKRNIRGVDVATNLVVTKTVELSRLRIAVEKFQQRLIHQINLAFAEIKAEMIANALENGVFLTGGGSLLVGLDQHLSQQLHTPILPSDDPYLDAVIGADLVRRLQD